MHIAQDKPIFFWHYENTPIQEYRKFHHQKKSLKFFIFLLKTYIVGTG